jgi:acyl carrier protein
MERRGVLSMEPELAISALAQALEEDRTMLTVTNTIWERFAPSFTAARPSPLLSGIPEARGALSDTDSDADRGESALAQRLAALPDDERERMVVDLVRAETATVLGHAGPEAVAVDQAFREQGFDSVTAVEMRERLKSATGLPVPASLVFDYPTPRAVAGYLLSKLVVDSTARGSVQDELERFEAALMATSADGSERAEIENRLEKILSRLRRPPSPAASEASDEDINSVPVAELLSIIDEQLSDRS